MMNKTNQNVVLTYDGKRIELPVYKATMGCDVVDMRRLYAELSLFSYDPGFLSTATCASQITYVNGQKGLMCYRGYPIEDLLERYNFTQMMYLVLYGELPNDQEAQQFHQSIVKEQQVDPRLLDCLKAYPKDAHPMGILMGLLSAMTSFESDTLSFESQAWRQAIQIRIIAQMPILIAMIYRHIQGKEILMPPKEGSYSSSFLQMMFADDERYPMSSVMEKAFDQILCLYIDHGQNASTATVRLCGSSKTHPFATIVAGVASLWGQSHGGAHEGCIHMLEDILSQGGVQAISNYMQAFKNPHSSQRLMGFGHRIYKTYDPRALYMRSISYAVFHSQGVQDNPLFEIALELEKRALEDDYFIQRHLYPNVDFYAGIVLNALGIPREMLTTIFALSRTVGWIAQWSEMLSDEDFRLSRPRQFYTGAVKRFIP